MRNFLLKFKYLDIPLLATMLLLLVAGFALLYSTTLNISGDSSGTIWRQILFLVFGLAGFFFLSLFDYHTLAKANRFIYFVLLILLVYVLFFGPNIRGGRRWIPLGFVNIQLAEFAKISVILGLSRLLYLRRGQINSWKNILLSFLYVLLPAILILREPDLGSAAVVIGIWAGTLLVSPIKKKYIAVLVIAAALICGLGWKFALKDFQRDRIMVFINPALDPKGRGYNVRQATIAIGSGQIFGRGLGQGLQSQNKFLPEQQTDFIFAASGEEVGFLGTCVILLLFFFLFFQILKISQKARDDLGMYIASGVFFFIFLHVLINVGMNIGLLPVTGIPLPFTSAGGSSLVVTLWALGIVQNVAVQSKTLRF